MRAHARHKEHWHDRTNLESPHSAGTSRREIARPGRTLARAARGSDAAVALPLDRRGDGAGNHAGVDRLGGARALAVTRWVVSAFVDEKVGPRELHKGGRACGWSWE